MTAPLSELQSAHQALMTRYVAVLDEARHMRWFVPVKQAPPAEPTWPKKLPKWLGRPLAWVFKPRANATQGTMVALRSLAHLFVEGHIRKKLKELAEAYLTLRAQAATDDKELRDWAKECGEVCDKMAGTLATWASIEGAFKFLWPFAVGGLTAWLGVKDIWEALRKLDATAYLIAYGILLFPVIYLLIFMSASFGYKRQLFMPGFDANERPFDPQATTREPNLYLLEDRLFELLGRRKSRERPWDIYFVALGCFVFGSPLLIFLRDGNPGLVIWLSSGFWWVVGIIALLRPKKRRWR